MKLGSELRLATSFFQRARGLLGTDGSKALLICPCGDVHTLGMRFPVDVAFIDSKGEVMRVETGVAPGRRLRQAGARAVLERRASQAPWFAPGERLVVLAVPQKEGFER